ncbi:MAG: hypothetical protein ACKO2N_05225, partial [Tabrizicola sp.]
MRDISVFSSRSRLLLNTDVRQTGSSKPTPLTYKARNWPAYNEALKRRGLLTIWFDPAMTWDAALTGKRGRQP